MDANDIKRSRKRSGVIVAIAVVFGVLLYVMSHQAGADPQQSATGDSPPVRVLASVPAQAPPDPSLDAQPQRQQIVEARALVAETWESYRLTLAGIELGYLCGAVDHLSADQAAMQIEVVMSGDANRAGLIGDPSIPGKAQAFVSSAIAQGKNAFAAGGCQTLTAADRARIRAMVATLMQQ